MIRNPYPKPFANKTAAGGKMLETIKRRPSTIWTPWDYIDEGPTRYPV